MIVIIVSIAVVVLVCALATEIIVKMCDNDCTFWRMLLALHIAIGAAIFNTAAINAIYGG